MSAFKEKAVQTLRKAAEEEKGVAAATIRQCADLVAAMDEDEPKGCSRPNYEDMYAKETVKTEKLMQELQCCNEVIRNLRSQNDRLTGFREAVQMLTERSAGKYLQ